MKHECEYQYSAPKRKNGTKFLHTTVYTKKCCVRDCNIVCVGLRENWDIESAVLICMLYFIASNAYQSHVICKSY
jgi:hypothetical protein